MPEGQITIPNEVQQNLAYHVPSRSTGRAGIALIRNMIHEEMNSRDDNFLNSYTR